MSEFIIYLTHKDFLLSFLAHLAKGHVSFFHHLAYIGVHSFVIHRKLSHLNLLLWNPRTELNQTWQGWSLGGSLSNYVRQPRLPFKMALLLKIEISSNGQNCSILSQNMYKFELYKHNDELFSKYDRIFYELWTFADFDRLCKLEKRGDEI